MLFLGDSCPECGGSLMDGGAGESWTCRVCEAEIETDGDGVVLEIRVPDREALATMEDEDKMMRGEMMGWMDQDEAEQLLGELFGNLARG